MKSNMDEVQKPGPTCGECFIILPSTAAGLDQFGGTPSVQDSPTNKSPQLDEGGSTTGPTMRLKTGCVVVVDDPIKLI